MDEGLELVEISFLIIISGPRKTSCRAVLAWHGCRGDPAASMVRLCKRKAPVDHRQRHKHIPQLGLQPCRSASSQLQRSTFVVWICTTDSERFVT